MPVVHATGGLADTVERLRRGHRSPARASCSSAFGRGPVPGRDPPCAGAAARPRALAALWSARHGGRLLVGRSAARYGALYDDVLRASHPPGSDRRARRRQLDGRLDDDARGGRAQPLGIESPRDAAEIRRPRSPRWRRRPSESPTSSVRSRDVRVSAQQLRHSGRVRLPRRQRVAADERAKRASTPSPSRIGATIRLGLVAEHRERDAGVARAPRAPPRCRDRGPSRRGDARRSTSRKRRTPSSTSAARVGPSARSTSRRAPSPTSAYTERGGISGRPKRPQHVVRRGGEVGARVDQRAVEVERDVRVAERGRARARTTGQAENDEPQPQVCFAFGLRT